MWSYREPQGAIWSQLKPQGAIGSYGMPQGAIGNHRKPLGAKSVWSEVMSHCAAYAAKKVWKSKVKEQPLFWSTKCVWSSVSTVQFFQPNPEAAMFHNQLRKAKKILEPHKCRPILVAKAKLNCMTSYLYCIIKLMLSSFLYVGHMILYSQGMYRKYVFNHLWLNGGCNDGWWSTEGVYMNLLILMYWYCISWEEGSIGYSCWPTDHVSPINARLWRNDNY